MSVRRIAGWDQRVHPIAFPWGTTKAATIVDCAALGSADDAIAWLALGIQRRFVDGLTLDNELQARGKVRHGVLMREVLGDITSGAHSVAEVCYARDVERAHRLPTASRQVPSTVSGRSVLDNEYAEWGVVVEVDGRLGHESWTDRVRDGARDRQLSGQGRVTTRLFWPDVATRPCQSANEIGDLLGSRGWTGRARPCRRADCVIAQDR